VAPTGDHLGYTAAPPRALDALTTAPDLVDRFPGFSPDGTTVLFSRVPTTAQTRSAGIWLADLDGRDLRQLSTDGAYPRWLP
jgi:Tol biopolymer transport system component